MPKQGTNTSMRGITKHKIVCNKCGKSDVVGMHESNLIWGSNKFIISGRKRLDGEWGWQCLCGQNTLVSKQERKTIKNLQSPDPKDIQQVIDMLVIQKDHKFKMETV